MLCSWRSAWRALGEVLFIPYQTSKWIKVFNLPGEFRRKTNWGLHTWDTCFAVSKVPLPWQLTTWSFLSRRNFLPIEVIFLYICPFATSQLHKNIGTPKINQCPFSASSASWSMTKCTPWLTGLVIALRTSFPTHSWQKSRSYPVGFFASKIEIDPAKLFLAPSSHAHICTMKTVSLISTSCLQ